MSTFAAVMTGRGSGAIATIQLVGDSAEAVMGKLFRRVGNRPLERTTSRILLGHIVDGDELVDQVTVGCEAPGVFAIHCHGNPLIVERIVGLLRRDGVTLLTAEQMVASQSPQDSIAAEAKIALATVKTIAGAEIIAHQVESGLSAKVRQWQRDLDTASLEQIASDVRRILEASETARLLISGCTIALVGPPNTGKSTLLNTLAGREKAVVTDIRGTTRDWVSAEIHIPPLAVTLIDTAGFDPSLTTDGEIDRAAQHKSAEIIDRADLVLLVLDAGQPVDQLSKSFADKFRDKRTIVVVNKADLPERLDCASLPRHLGRPVRISSKQGRGIEALIEAIHLLLGIAAFDPETTVAFTPRQTLLLDQLKHTQSATEAHRIIAELPGGLGAMGRERTTAEDL